LHLADSKKHISTCLPFSFRPPNPPPDLPQLINDALLAAHGTRPPSSLLELHCATTSSDLLRDNRLDLPAANQAAAASTSAAPRKASSKPAQQMGLRGVTTVLAADTRGEGWDDEVDGRVHEFIGSSPWRGSRGGVDATRDEWTVAAAGQMDSADDDGLTTPLSPYFPTTQPMGESSLAMQFGRQARAETPTSPAASARRTVPEVEISDITATEMPEDVPMSTPTDDGVPTGRPQDDQENVPPSSQPDPPVFSGSALSPSASLNDFNTPPASQRRRGKFIFNKRASQEIATATPPLASTPPARSPHSPRTTSNLTERPFRAGGSLRAEAGSPWRSYSVQG
jgi:hypothetical protein